jgi:hypothetical protein
LQYLLAQPVEPVLILRGDEVLTASEITVCCIKIPEAKLCSMPADLIAFGPA